MKSEIKITCSAEGEATIDIEGTIGVSERMQFDEPKDRVATYERFREALDRIGRLDADRITVNIRSTGGSVADALLIYDALCATEAVVTTRCYGYTASAATVIAQAAASGKREISPNALYLIHRSASCAEGNAVELQQSVDLLSKTDRRLAEIYSARSGRDVADIEALMAENGGNGRWLAPEEAVEAGLADRIIVEEPHRKSALKRIAGTAEKLVAVLRRAVGGQRQKTSATVAPVTDPTSVMPSAAAYDAAVENLCRGQEAVSPTRTLEREDPSQRGEEITPNGMSYRRDADALRGSL